MMSCDKHPMETQWKGYALYCKLRVKLMSFQHASYSQHAGKDSEKSKPVRTSVKVCDWILTDTHLICRYVIVIFYYCFIVLNSLDVTFELLVHPAWYYLLQKLYPITVPLKKTVSVCVKAVYVGRVCVLRI